MTPEYELTWHFECSGDEAALAIYDSVRGMAKTMETLVPGGYKISVSLAKIMKEK